MNEGEWNWMNAFCLNCLRLGACVLATIIAFGVSIFANHIHAHLHVRSHQFWFIFSVNCFLLIPLLMVLFCFVSLSIILVISYVHKFGKSVKHHNSFTWFGSRFFLHWLIPLLIYIHNVFLFALMLLFAVFFIHLPIHWWHSKWNGVHFILIVTVLFLQLFSFFASLLLFLW